VDEMLAAELDEEIGAPEDDGILFDRIDD